MIYQVEYIKDNTNKVTEYYQSYEEAEKFIKDNNLIVVRHPEEENEARIIGVGKEV